MTKVKVTVKIDPVTVVENGGAQYCRHLGVQCRFYGINKCNLFSRYPAVVDPSRIFSYALRPQWCKDAEVTVAMETPLFEQIEEAAKRVDKWPSELQIAREKSYEADEYIRKRDSTSDKSTHENTGRGSKKKSKRVSKSKAEKEVLEAQISQIRKRIDSIDEAREALQNFLAVWGK